MSCRDVNSDLSDRSCDTLTSVSKPVKTSKEWLIYSVRFLSRVYVEKGEGQDGVWSEKCKPEWWDREVGLRWRNPTGKSKDTIDDLKKKYEALARKLREEKRFPAGFDDEAKLWDDGKVDELFQLVSEKNVYAILQNLICVCSSHVDKYGLFTPDIGSKILIEINNLLSSIKVQSKPELHRPNIDKEAEKTKISPIILESSVSLDVFISKSTKKFNSAKQKTKSSASCTSFKQKRNKSLNLQTEFNTSSSHEVNSNIQKSSKNNQSPHISNKSGSENVVMPVCSSTNYNKAHLGAVESNVKRNRRIEHPDISSFSQKDLVDVIIPESHNGIETNFAKTDNKEMFLKRKSPSYSVYTSHCKKRRESSLREKPSNSITINVDVASKSCQNASFINLEKKYTQGQDFKKNIEENTKRFKNNANEDYLSAPSHLSTEEVLLMENIFETFTGDEQNILFAGNSQDVVNLFLELPVVEPSHDLRRLDDL